MGLCGSTVEVQTTDEMAVVVPGGSGAKATPKPSNRSRIALKVDDDDGLSPRPDQKTPSKQNDRKLETFPEETHTNTAHGAEEGDGAYADVKLDVVEVKEGDSSKAFKAASLTRKGFIPYHNIDNQDAELIVTGLQDDPNISLFAVMDGHGEFGGEVAQYVREHFPYHLAAQLDLKADPAFAIAKGVKDTTIALQRSRQIDLSFSGCTLCFVLKIGATLFIGNIGEARCVLARVLRFDDSYDVDLDPVGLSLEHVPDNEMEALRIQKMGGRIKPMDVPPGEHPGPNRIWLKEAEAPGLTVSRAIGDEVAQTVGVISVPEVRQYDVDEDDLFFVLATDGLWKFMSNMEVVVICQRYADDLGSACKHLVREARKRWQAREEVVDDVTVVVVKLNDSNLTFKSVAAYKEKDKDKKDKDKDKKDKKKRK